MQSNIPSHSTPLTPSLQGYINNQPVANQTDHTPFIDDSQTSSSNNWHQFNAKDFISSLAQHLKTNNADTLRGHATLIEKLCFGTLNINANYGLDQNQTELDNLAKDLGIRSHVLGRAILRAQTPEALKNSIELEIDYCKAHEFKKTSNLIIQYIGFLSFFTINYRNKNLTRLSIEELKAFALLNNALVQRAEDTLTPLMNGLRTTPKSNTADEVNATKNIKRMIVQIKLNFSIMRSHSNTKAHKFNDLEQTENLNQIDAYSELTKALSKERQHIAQVDLIKEVNETQGSLKWKQEADSIFNNWDMLNTLEIRVMATGFLHISNQLINKLTANGNLQGLPEQVRKDLIDYIQMLQEQSKMDINPYYELKFGNTFNNSEYNDLIKTHWHKTSKQASICYTSLMHFRDKLESPSIAYNFRKNITKYLQKYVSEYKEIESYLNQCVQSTDEYLIDGGFSDNINAFSHIQAHMNKVADDAMNTLLEQGTVNTPQKKPSGKKKKVKSEKKANQARSNTTETQSTTAELATNTLKRVESLQRQDIQNIILNDLSFADTGTWHNPSVNLEIKQFIREPKFCSFIVPPTADDQINSLSHPDISLLQSIDIYPTRSPKSGETIDVHIQRRHPAFFQTICDQSQTNKVRIQQVADTITEVFRNMQSATIEPNAVYTPNEHVTLSFPVLMIDGQFQGQTLRVVLSKPFFSNIDSTTPNPTRCLVVRSVYPLNQTN